MARKRTASGAVPAVEIIEHGKRRYAAGLLWKPVRSIRNYLGEARAGGKAEGMHAYVIQHGRTQTLAGYAPRVKGGQGAYALAPALIDVLGSEWIGAFALDGSRYVLIAVHAGAVLPGYDIVGDFKAVSAQMRTAYSMLSADTDFAEHGMVVAPEVFDFGTEDHRDLATLLAAARITPAMRLKPLGLSLKPAHVVVGGGLLMVAAAFYGYASWRDRQRADELAAAQAAVEQAQTDAPPTRVETPPPWLTDPAPLDVAAACQRLTARIPLSVAGWRVTSVTCGPAAASAVYERAETGAPVLAFKEAVAVVLGDFTTAVDAAGTQATASTAVGGHIPKTDDTLLGSALLRERAVDYNQRLPGLVTIRLTERPYTPPPDDPERPPPPWVVFDLGVDSEVPPAVALGGLDLNGLRLAGITARIEATGRMTWTLTGAWYASR